MNINRDYAAKVFGFRTFGKVFGLVMCISGLFNFSQYGLDALTHRFFHADPIPVDVALLILGFITGSVLVGYIWRQSHVLKRSLLEREAEEAVEVVLPGPDDTST